MHPVLLCRPETVQTVQSQFHSLFCERLGSNIMLYILVTIRVGCPKLETDLSSSIMAQICPEQYGPCYGCWETSTLGRCSWTWVTKHLRPQRCQMLMCMGCLCYDNGLRGRQEKEMLNILENTQQWPGARETTPVLSSVSWRLTHNLARRPADTGRFHAEIGPGWPGRNCARS